MIIFSGGMYLDEGEKFCGHDHSALGRLLVCAACGSRVRTFLWPGRGLKVVCAANTAHNHFILESEWEQLQRENAAITPEMVKEALADPVVGPMIQEALRLRNKQHLSAMFGEQEEQ